MAGIQMKACLILFLFLASTLHAEEIMKRAVVRDDNFKAMIQEVKLENLTSNESFEGKFFKIVKGKSNEAVRFDDNEDMQLRAATTYYHLSKARDYFSHVAKSDFVRNLPQIIVRVELTNVFNEIGHFANDNLNPQFNNALTVPAGKGYPPKNIPPWGIEIWFRPSKEINIKDFQGSVDRPSVKGAIVDFRNQTHMTNFKQFMTTLLSGGIISDPGSVMRLVGSSLLMEAIYQSSDLAADFFSRKIYFLDSALVPEIIYHEFAHVALSSHMELSHSTPVNEGMADYFAGKIAKSKKLALKIKEYNLFNGKEVQKKQQYNLAFERGEYANADFVFGLLWNVGATVGEDIEIPFMKNLASKLTTNANIRDDLIQASLDSCKEICKKPSTDQLKLYTLFHKKNL